MVRAVVAGPLELALGLAEMDVADVDQLPVEASPSLTLTPPTSTGGMLRFSQAASWRLISSASAPGLSLR